MGHLRNAGRYAGDPHLADAALATLAGEQERVFTLEQAVACGWSRPMLQRRVERGFVHRLFPGVYALGPPPVGASARYRGAVCACGETARLSFRSAGDLRRIARTSRSRVDVTTTARRRGVAGIEVHRTRSFHPDDLDELDGIPITSWARTVVDLAEILPPDRVGRVLHESEYQRVFDLRALEEAITRAHGRHGLKHLVAALAAFRPRGETESGLEDDFLDLLDAAGLELPLTQQWIEACGTRHRVDAFFPGQRLCVELDGRQAHSTSSRFVGDRRRDVDLHVAGFVPIRFTGADLTTGRARTERRLRQLGVPNR